MKKIIAISGLLLAAFIVIFAGRSFLKAKHMSRVLAAQKPLIMLNGQLANGNKVYEVIHKAVKKDDVTDFKVQVLCEDNQYTLDLNNKYIRTEVVREMVDPWSSRYLRPDHKYSVTVIQNLDNTIQTVVVGEIVNEGR